MSRNRRGQVTAEQAVLLTFVIAGFVFMGFYLQRGAQGGTKSNADALGQQFSTQGRWNSTVTQTSNTTGNTTNSTSASTYTHNLQ